MFYLSSLYPRGLFLDGGGDAGNDADNTDNADNNDTDDDAGNKDPLEAFEAWLDEQPEELRTTVEGHTSNLVSALRKERKANKGAKEQSKRLAELEDEKRKQNEADQGELETLKSKNAELTKLVENSDAQIKKLTINHAVLTAAAQMDFEDPDDALLFIDTDALEADEDGNVTGVKDALKSVIKKRPYLLKQKLDDSDNDTDDNKGGLDKDPDKQRKIKEGQPKLSI